MTGRGLPEDLSWDDLRHLEAVERLGSAAAAGRELGVAVSTVYRRVSALEEALDVRCYVRGEGVTPVARELAALARKTLSGLVEIRRRTREDHGEVRGRVTVTTIDGFMPLLIEPLRVLARRFPELQIDLDISNSGLSVRKGEAEIALSAVARPGNQLVGRRLFPIEFGVFGVPELVEQYRSASWITLAAPLHNTQIARWERSALPEGRVAISTASRRSFNDLVSAGVGIGVMPRKLAALDPVLVEVESYREATQELTTPAWLLTHPQLQKSTLVSTVLRTIADFLSR